MKAIPTMCNWSKFQNAPNKIYNVPVLVSIWSLLSRNVFERMTDVDLEKVWIYTVPGSGLKDWCSEHGVDDRARGCCSLRRTSHPALSVALRCLPVFMVSWLSAQTPPHRSDKSGADLAEWQ